MILNRTRLEKWKDKEGRTWTWLAERGGIKPRTLYQQLAGRTGISLRAALAVENATGIPLRELVVTADAE